MPRRVRYKHKYVRAGRISLVNEDDGTSDTIEIQNNKPLRFENEVTFLDASAPQLKFGDYTVEYVLATDGKKELHFKVDGEVKFLMKS